MLKLALSNSGDLPLVLIQFDDYLNWPDGPWEIESQHIQLPEVFIIWGEAGGLVLGGRD